MSQLFPSKNTLQIGEVFAMDNIVQNQPVTNIQLPGGFCPGMTVMQGPCMWQQHQGPWLHSTPQVHYPYLGMALGYYTQSAPQRVCANQFLRSAPYWLPHKKLHSDQYPPKCWPETYSMAYQAGYPSSYRHMPMDARMWPILTTVPQATNSLIHQAGTSTCLAEQAAGPLLQSCGPRAGPSTPIPTSLTQVSGTDQQGAGDSSFHKVTSLGEAMKIFCCEPEARQEAEPEPEDRQAAEPETSTQMPQELGSSPSLVLGVVPRYPTVDHSLDHEDMEACVQRLLDAQASQEARGPVAAVAAAQDSGMEFFYQVDSLGCLCDLQLFGQTLASSIEEESSHMEFLS